MHKIINSKSVFKGHVFEAKVETVILPNGEQASREVIIHKGGVSIVALYNKSIVLVRQYRHAVGEYVLEIPAGIIEAGEDPINTAERELREETGFYSYNITPLISMYKSMGYSTENHHIYLATDLIQGEQDLDAEEDIEIVIIPIEKVIEMIFSGEIFDAKTIAGVLAYKEKFINIT